MKFIVVVSITLITFLNAFTASAKVKDLVRANYYFSHNQFHEAIPYYEKIADDENDPMIYGKLGDCYKLTSNIPKAAEWYAKGVALQGCKDEIILHYAQVLMELMKYDTAKKYLIDYQSRNTNDKRAANLIAGCSSAPDMLKAKPKGQIMFLNMNTNGSEYAPTFWKDKLVFTADVNVDNEKSKNKIKDFTFNSLYFVPCDRDGNTGKEFKKITIKGKGEKENVGPATFSGDGKKMYFTITKTEDMHAVTQTVSKNVVALPLEILIASDMDTSNNQFQEFKPFKYNSKTYSVAHPTISPDGSLLIFTSDMPGGKGGSDLYICKKMQDDEWSSPVNLGKEVNTEGEEVFPYLADNNTLFFSSDGHEGMGGLDVYMSKFDDNTGSFGTPINLGTPINSSYDDISLSLYADGRSSYFSSNRPALKEGDNIYFFNRSHAYLHIKLFDDVTNDPLNVANVVLESQGEKHYVTVDKFGEFIAPVYNDIKYKLIVSKNGYLSKNLVINTTDFKENDTVTQTVNLTSSNTTKESPIASAKSKEPVMEKNEPPAKVRDSNYYKKPSYLIMTIVDSNTKKAIKKATVSLESERDTREIVSNEKGKCFTQLIPEIQYAIHVSKTGYNTKEITLKTIFGHEEPDTFSEKVALSLAKYTKNKKPKTSTAREESTTDAQDGNTKEKKDKHKNKKIKDDNSSTDEPSDIAQKEKKEHAPDKEGNDWSGANVVKGKQYSLNGYYAEYNKYEIVDAKKYILDSLVMMLTENPKMRIRIEGHADCRGGAAYNLKLSTNRAIAVGKYLVSKGIDPKRLEHKGWGVTKPVVKCPVCNDCNEQQHEQNRGFNYVVIHK